MFTANPTNNKDAALKDIKNSAANIRDEAMSTAYEVKDDLRDAANQTGRKVYNFFTSATDEISHASDVVTKQVRSNPVQSSLIALGAGFVLGALFRR
jgi:ElaB/YqjD/DUF883 family membrane-anchored ribosome-binding protein